MRPRLIVCTILAAFLPRAATALAQDNDGFSSSNLQAKYGWNKYGISGLQDNLLLPVVVWVM